MAICFLVMAGDEGYKQCAVVASDRALDKPGSHPSSAEINLGS